MVKGWREVGGGVWKVEIPNERFGAFNPFADEIRGDWFDPRGRKHHTGAIYLNGDWLTEAKTLEEVFARETPRWVTRLTEGYLMNVAWIAAGGPRTTADGLVPEGGPRFADSEEEGKCLGWIEDGDGAMTEIDFGTGSTQLEARVASQTMGGEIEVRLGSRQGRLLTTLAVSNTGGWSTWETVRANIRRISGKQKVYLLFQGPARLNTNPLLWFARVGDKTTEVWARFGGKNPNQADVEMNVRQTVFYPSEPGIDYITVRGFEMSQAATPWAPPTAEQKAMIGTHWSRGWIIENNRIHHSTCAGIALGKHGDQFDNTSADTAEGYVETIRRAHEFRIPWTKERIGNHIVRNNEVFACEQVGIVGSLGAAFSQITDNTVRDIHTRMYFHGAEMAGMKFHGAIDTLIARNRVSRTYQGLWLDWMTQGTQISQNLFFENLTVDVWFEVNHGPFIMDRNALLSSTSLRDQSQGGVFAANLFGGRIEKMDELNRSTPFMKPHSTDVAGMSVTKGADHRYIGNVFARGGLQGYERFPQPILVRDNVYAGTAAPLKGEEGAQVIPGDIALRAGRFGVSGRGAAWDRIRGLTSAAVTPGSLPAPLIAGVPFAGFEGEPWGLPALRYGALFGPEMLRR
jgi:hypothetical protein